MTSHILFVDNDHDFLSTRTEFLEQEGFEVFKALTISEAQWFLENANVHLAIVDVRMENEDDARDVSGLRIITQEAYRCIPKIILTGYPSADTARISLKPQSGGRGLAIDYIKKEDPPEIFIQAIHDVFARDVRINWDLNIDWKASDLYSVVNFIESGLQGKRFLNRAEELEDLFRRLFYEKEHIRIERLLWQRNGRVALVVFAFKENAKQESYVVICGQSSIVNEEAHRFEEFAPRVPSETGTVLSLRAETTHFAANAYTVVGNDLEKNQTLGEFYRFAQEKVFKDTVTTLFQNTLQDWHQDKPIVEKNNSLDTLYRQRLELTEEYFSKAGFEERIKVIMSQIATMGSRITRTDKVLTIQLNNQAFSFPDPLLILSRTPDRKEEILAINAPGILTGDNILADESGHTWLTDFAGAGLAPLYWNFVALEAAIRFDWTESNELLRRYELENCLLNTEFAKPDTRDLEPMIRKPGRAIQTIRKLAARTVGNDVLAYHHGIFFQAARRLADFNPANPVTSKELARLGHILLSMSMIAGKLNQDKADGQPVMIPVQEDQITIMDEKARIVMIGHRKEHLAPQPFEILLYLYNHAYEVCTKEEIQKVALKGEKYEDGYLHTLIGRIRKVIEDDPEHPRYLITEPSAGYRLIPKPKN